MFSKIAQKVPKYFEHFWRNICLRELSKIAHLVTLSTHKYSLLLFLPPFLSLSFNLTHTRCIAPNLSLSLYLCCTRHTHCSSFPLSLSHSRGPVVSALANFSVRFRSSESPFNFLAWHTRDQMEVFKWHNNKSKYDNNITRFCDVIIKRLVKGRENWSSGSWVRIPVPYTDLYIDLL